MNSGFRIYLFLLALLLLPMGCKVKTNQELQVPGILIDEPDSTAVKVSMIFYNMYLPTEMSRLFERVGANYNPKILNSSDNFSRYDNKDKIALNIGVYGVDLSYCRIFGQNAATAKYFSTVQILNDKLGIPDYYYNDLATGFEKYYNDKDSLAKFAGNVYERIDQYLRENKDDSYAALIITGGWIEAIYLASKIAESNPDNVEISERIAGQKYSLNSLISVLSNYQDDIVITEYILMLKGLKKSFDKFDIYYNQDNFQLDTLNKRITSSEYEMNFSPLILSEINATVGDIRAEIVN